jgi:hypothetical protein
MTLGIAERHSKKASLTFLWLGENAAREFPGKLLDFLAKEQAFLGQKRLFLGRKMGKIRGFQLLFG